MLDLIIRHKATAALIVFSLFCLISLSVQSSTFTLSVEGVGSALVMPFQKLYNYGQDGVHRFWAGFTELGEVRAELKQAHDKLREYEAAAENLDEMKRENARLRDLLGMKERVKYDTVPAQVISKDPDNWFRTMILNRGSNDGIAINMPVIAFTGDSKAVVGKIGEVRGSVSRVLPIISPDMKMGVMLKDSRFPGLLEGYSSNAGFCQIDYISKSAPVTAGEMVITSGQGGIFPPGILVGRVVSGMVLKSSAFQRAIVKPVVDYDRIEEVLVITKVPDEEFMSLLNEGEQAQ